MGQRGSFESGAAVALRERSQHAIDPIAWDRFVIACGGSFLSSWKVVRAESLLRTVRVFDLVSPAAPHIKLGQCAVGVGRRRVRFLDAQLVAAQTRLRMMRGENLPFVDEAEGLFGVRPETPDLATFDPLIARIGALVPGEGPLWQRIDAFNNRFNIPADRLKPVMDAAIAECRKRTLAHYTLPEGERFDLALVTDKPKVTGSLERPAAKLVIQLIAPTRTPNCLSAMTSGTVLMPTASAPRAANMRISAGVS